MPILVTLVDGTVPVAADFNGNYAALNAAIGTGTAIVAYTTGDLVYASATNTLVRKAIGSSGQVLTVVGGVPDWQPSAGLTDQLTGLSLTRTSATSITVGVGAAASDDAVLVNRTLMSVTSAILGTFSSTWVVGNNQPKLDTGAIAASTTYHFFVIERTDTGVVDWIMSLSATAPTLPASYGKQRRIGSRRTNGSSQFDDWVQDGDYVRLKASVLDVDLVPADTSAHTAVLTSVPTGVNFFAVVNVVFIIAGTAGILYLSDLAVTDEAASTTAAPLGTISSNIANEISAVPVQIRTDTAASIRYRASAVDGNTHLRIATLGWIDRRGKG